MTIRSRAVHSLSRRALGSLALSIATLSPCAVSGQLEMTCTEVEPQAGEFGYAFRGNRCEGLFIAPIRSSVRLKALLGPSAATDAVPGVVTISLPEGAPAGLYEVEVQPLDPSEPYRLKAPIATRESFSWPVDEVLGPVGIDAGELGVLSLALEDPSHYVPAYFPSSRAATELDPDSVAALVVVESTVPVQQFVANLSAEGNSSATHVVLRSRVPLPATQVELPVPRQLESGLYRLWLTVRLLGQARPEQQSWVLWLP